MPSARGCPSSRALLAPVEDPAVYETAWSDFVKHLEKVTGKKVKFFGLQNYGAVPFAIMKDPKGLSGSGSSCS